MQVNRIWLKDYRNYDELSLSFEKGVNIFYGANAQGKTNLLEAVYYAAFGRSHRTTNDQECIRQGTKEAAVRVLFAKQHTSEEQIEVFLRKNGKKSILVNRFPVRKISEVFGLLKVVLFSPEDLSLIKSGPALRRRFMDMEMCQVDPIYLYELQQFYKVLRQRNTLLKEMQGKRLSWREAEETLYPWDAQLAYYGARLVEKREAFSEEIQPFCREIHQTISEEKEDLRLKYVTNASGKEDTFLELLGKSRDKDIRYGSTTIGLQHDDLEIYLNDMNARSFGSQGQQRSAALSLKLAETRKIKKESGCEPVLLLDDVMSELDRTRQNQLIGFIQDMQTFITCTGAENLLQTVQTGTIYHVAGGSVTCEKAT